MMKLSTMRVTLTLAIVVIISASSLTFARAQKPSGGSQLSGTSWQLVRFQAPDDSIVTPDDKSKYSIKFGSNGRVTARVDCNRASSTWKVNAKGQLQFGSWSRTSAKCGPGSLHDQIVRDGADVRNFSIKDGHLFLSGTEGGGYYELEPMPAGRQ